MLARGDNGVGAYIGRSTAASTERARPVAGLALPLGAKERRSPGLHNAAHSLAAVTTGARTPFAAVDRPAMLKIAERAIGLDIIAQRRTSCCNRLGQDRPDRRSQPLRPPAADRRGQTAWREPGAEQCLADIDVAEAGDDPLIEQRCLE